MAGLSLLSVLLLLAPSASLASPYGGRPLESTTAEVARDLPINSTTVSISSTAAPSTLLSTSAAPIVSAYGVPSMDQPAVVTEDTSTTASSSSASPYVPALTVAGKVVVAADAPTTAVPSTFSYVLNEEAARKYWATASFAAGTTTTAAPVSDRPFLLVDETTAPSIIVEKPSDNSYGEPTKEETSTTASSSASPYVPALPVAGKAVVAADAPTTAAPSTFSYVLNEEAARKYWATASFAAETTTPAAPASDRPFLLVDETTSPSIIVEKPTDNSYAGPTKPNDASSTLAPLSLDTATTEDYQAESTTYESVLPTSHYGKPVIVPQADIPAVGALLQKMGDGSPAPFIVIIVPSNLEHIKAITGTPSQDAESKFVSEYTTVSTTYAPSTAAVTSRGYQKSTTSGYQHPSSSSLTESLDLPKTTSTAGKY